MLDLNDFITERGGNPNKIKESQRKRFAPEEAVDEVIALYEEARRGKLVDIQADDYLWGKKRHGNQRTIRGKVCADTQWFSPV